MKFCMLVWIVKNADLERQIKMKQEALEDVLEELPLKMFQFSKARCTNLPEDILDLIEEK